MKELGLIVLLMALTYGAGFFLFNDPVLAIVGPVMSVILGSFSKVSAFMMLRENNCRPLDENEWPWAYESLRDLCFKAKLTTVPSLYLIASRRPNAMALQDGEQYFLALSEGILQALDRREITAVLAHELAHMAHGDPFFLKILNSLYSFIAVLSSLINFSFLIFFPLYLTGVFRVGLLTVLSVFLAPTLMRLLILAVMRGREYWADMEAARMTGDPRALASALMKLQQFENGPIMFFFPYRPGRGPSLLDSHPLPKERVKRLLELE